MARSFKIAQNSESKTEKRMDILSFIRPINFFTLLMNL